MASDRDSGRADRVSTVVSSNVSRRQWLQGAGTGLVVGLSGCLGLGSGDDGSDGGDGNSSDTDGTSSGTMGNKPFEGTTIEFRAYNGPGLEEFFSKHAKKFKQETGITVKWKLLGWSNGFSKQLADITSRTGPDCGEIPSAYLPQQMQANGWVKMEQFFDDDRFPNLNRKTWFQSPLKETCTYQAAGDSEPHVYPVPWYWGPRGQVTNSVMMKEAGVSGRPKTWDGLVSKGKTFRETYSDKNYLGLSVNGNSLKMFSNLLWQQGGTFFDDRYNPQEVTFNSDKGAKALNFWKKMLTTHNTIPQSSIEWDNASFRSAFYNDRVGAVLGDVGFVNVYLENNDSASRSDFKIYKPPKGPGSKGQSSVFFGEEGLGIHPWSDKKEASAKWINYLLRPGVNAEIAATVGLIPGVKQAYNEHEPFTTDPLLQDYKNIMPVAKTWPLMNGWSRIKSTMTRVLRDELQQVISQDDPNAGNTENALKEAAQEASDVISEN